MDFLRPYGLTCRENFNAAVSQVNCDTAALLGYLEYFSVNNCRYLSNIHNRRNKDSKSDNDTTGNGIGMRSIDSNTDILHHFER